MFKSQAKQVHGNMELGDKKATLCTPNPLPLPFDMLGDRKVPAIRNYYIQQSQVQH